ncbi:glycosyltransferase family 4 protein [Natrialbaceae archaeon A-CW2]
MSQKGKLSVGIICGKINNKQGGSNYSIHRLATELTQRGHKTDVITLNFEYENKPPKNYQYNLIESPLENRTVFDGTVKMIRNIDNLANGRDILHIYVPELLPLFGLWRKSGGETPVVGHLNAYRPICTNPAMMNNRCWETCSVSDKVNHANKSGVDVLSQIPRYLFNHFTAVKLINYMDKVFALSPALADIYQDAGLNEAIIQISPNMTDPNFSMPERVPGEFSEDSIPQFCYVGRLIPEKGVDILIEAIKKLPEKKPFHVDIVGENTLDNGPSSNELQEKVIQDGIDDRITFHGWVNYNDLPFYYARGDVFVHPGRWPEPFGRTIIEALQSNCAVVASDVGGPPWVAGDAGVVFPRGDVDALANQLNQLLNNPNQVSDLQSNAAKELKRFEPEYVTEGIISTYSSCLE